MPGRRRILVELEEGGKYLIRVTDDGSGMSREDAVLSLQRHATSKIRTADDLFQITTMGFRGEALPSIASVSQMSITTKAAGDDEAAGVQVRCAGGSLEEVSEVGARVGTSITVENLFYNVPARLKFLKSSSTELGHIVELMQRFALARPDVAFRLLHGGGEAFASGGSGSAMDACVHVFGRETARHLVPLNYDARGPARDGLYRNARRAENQPLRPAHVCQHALCAKQGRHAGAWTRRIKASKRCTERATRRRW